MPEEPNPPTNESSWLSLRKYWRLLQLALLFLMIWLMAAYFVLPLIWRFATRHHPALEDLPRITRTSNGIHGDPLNIALVGSEDEVVAAMLTANWSPADSITMKSSLRIAAATVRGRSYETAPVSNLYLWERKQDLAFEQPSGKDPKRRHHVRFWRSEKVDENGRPLWAGAATFDTRVGFSHTTGQITHHIDADVDTERDKLLDDLDKAGLITVVTWLDGFHEELRGRNGGGDPYYTDGKLLIVYVVPQTIKSDSSKGQDAPLEVH